MTIKTRQSGRGILVILIIVAAIALLVWWIAKTGYELPDQASENTVQNTEDLNSLSAELDSTDLNEMDPDIKKLETDSSAF